MIYYTIMQSPVGELLLIKERETLTGLYFTRYKKCPHIENSWIEDASQFEAIKKQLNDYLTGKNEAFNLPFSTKGTDFQQQVWSYLFSIPYGKTVTYKEIAVALGRPKAMRAVGTAVGSNPLCIIRPCHRVLATGGGIGGYAGGIDAKRTLLALEGIPS